MRNFRLAIGIAALIGIVCLPCRVFGQSINQAQIRGTITDSSGAAIQGATVTITDVGTNISQSTTSNRTGGYAFTALVASNYKMLIDSPGFGPVEKTGITLTVNEHTILNVTMKPVSQKTSVTVEAIPVLLDSGTATLGTDIPEKQLTQIPLENRDPFGLTFLAAGVTESAGSGITDSYPAGTNFISNGQRNSTANIRLDGVLITAPEQGEGGNSNTYYQATVEGLQEVQVQNNSFSAEYGGGTVINEQMKSGTNQFHGSAYWFNQNSAYDARDFFNSGPKPGHSQNQDGFSLGGPIVKDKTFFFADLESVVASNPVNIVATVPTTAEINGDFSKAMTYDANGNPVLNQIFDPHKINLNTVLRPAYPNNTIPAGEIDKVGQAIMKLYPKPNTPGDPVTGANNFRDVILSSSHSLQVDVKINQQFNSKSFLSVRYSSIFGSGNTPTVLGDGEFNDGTAYNEQIYNDGINYTYTPTPNTVWTSTFGLDRVSQPSFSNYPSPTSVGFPDYLIQNGINRMPSIIMEDQPWTSIYDQCCVDTKFAHTLLNYTSAFAWTRGNHTVKTGGSQQIFYNNFFQPNYPDGYFSFAQDVTSQSPFNTINGVQGNDFAGLLLGWGDPGGSGINVTQSVADKSKETAFYIQDDWRTTSKLTLNLGLRYQWDTPYTERHNNTQFSDFTGNSGISVAVPGHTEPLLGTTIFASPSRRNLPTDWSDIGPRLGFAYLINDKTVIRGGAGIYFGYGVATNFQYPGAAYTASPEAFFSKDGGVTQYATLENPFPGGIPPAQGQKYGKLALWGLQNVNNLGTQTAKNADIYQWNLGIQQVMPDNIVIAVNYSANRSTYLPFAGTDNRNFIASSIRSHYTSQELNNLVNNPFRPLFTGPHAIFNVPSSRYSDPQLPLLNLLRPYPQFDGAFNGYKIIGASSWYNALEFVFQKRAGAYLTFEGNYTWSKNMDDSSAGNNDWVGTIGLGLPQELDHLKREWSVSANDATNRLVAAVVYQLPIGRGYLVGANMNRALNAVIGGWKLTTLATLQSGQPLDIFMGNPRLADGNQRPNVTCPNSNSLTTGISIHHAAFNQVPYINANCFSDPGDQQAGDAPRYFSRLRTDGIHEADITLEKVFTFGPRAGHLEVHADCFNCTNTPRFGLPDTGYEDSTFGVISSSAGGALPRNMQLGVRYQF